MIMMNFNPDVIGSQYYLNSDSPHSSPSSLSSSASSSSSSSSSPSSSLASEPSLLTNVSSGSFNGYHHRTVATNISNNNSNTHHHDLLTTAAKGIVHGLHSNNGIIPPLPMLSTSPHTCGATPVTVAASATSHLHHLNLHSLATGEEDGPTTPNTSTVGTGNNEGVGLFTGDVGSVGATQSHQKRFTVSHLLDLDELPGRQSYSMIFSDDEPISPSENDYQHNIRGGDLRLTQGGCFLARNETPPVEGRPSSSGSPDTEKSEGIIPFNLLE